MQDTVDIPGVGKYEKQCAGCKKKFRTDARNARFAPSELKLCKCLDNRAKHRAKRRRERREYHKNPEHYREKSRSRNAARTLVLSYHGVAFKKKDTNDWEKIMELGCNSPGCQTNFENELAKELELRSKSGKGPRGAKPAALKNLLKQLEAHHRDHNYLNNYLESYPERSNIELLCRRHHEQADRAKPTVDKDGVTRTHADLILYRDRPFQYFGDYLLDLRKNNPRKFFHVSVFKLWEIWLKS